MIVSHKETLMLLRRPRLQTTHTTWESSRPTVTPQNRYKDVT